MTSRILTWPARLVASGRGRWAVVLAAAIVATLVVLRPDRGDVAIYRHAARAALTTGDVYRYQHLGNGFTYPPFAALALSPLAWLPNWAMWCALVLLGVASLGVVLALSSPPARTAVLGRPGVAALGLAAIIAGEPVVTTLRFGQLDLLLAAAVMADVLVFRNGFLLGLAVAVKLTPALFVIHLLHQRRVREVATATAVFLASVLWGLMVLPRASVTYWSHNVLSGTNVSSFTSVGNQSLHGVVSRMVGAQVGTAAWIVLAVPTVALGLDLARRVAVRDQVLAVGMVGVVGCLVSPLSWPHHWVWIIPLLYGLWRVPGRDATLSRWIAGTAVFCVVSQFVPIKAIGIGYVPITVALIVLARTRLHPARRATFT